MKRRLVVILAIALIEQICFCKADVIFSDDFNANIFDSSKWTEIVDSGCSLDMSGGVLHNHFTGATAPRGSYAKSVPVSLPGGWSSVVITGQWAFPIQVFGEMVMKVENTDNSMSYEQVGYYVWGGPGFRARQPEQSDYELARNIPLTLTDFEWTITKTGWMFKEYNNGNWETLVDRSTALFADMNTMSLQIGGWEFSYTSMQRTDYDNISIIVIPEPITIIMVCIGGILLKRK